MRLDASPIKVLILEDNDVVATIASHFLRRAGYHVRLATSTDQASRMLERLSPSVDVLLCDLEFDDLHGKEAALALVGRKPGLRVAFICGTNCAAVHERLDAVDESPRVGQPFTPSQVLRSVTHALAGIPPA
ncbi:MAG: response regulator [Gemmatimonadales bacterium]